MSTAMIVVAAVSRAASTAERPTAPAPNTAMLSPGWGRSTFSTVPDACLHPAVDRGQGGELVLVDVSVGTTLRSLTRACCASDD